LYFRKFHRYPNENRSIESIEKSLTTREDVNETDQNYVVYYKLACSTCSTVFESEDALGIHMRSKICRRSIPSIKSKASKAPSKTSKKRQTASVKKTKAPAAKKAKKATKKNVTKAKSTTSSSSSASSSTKSTTSSSSSSSSVPSTTGTSAEDIMLQQALAMSMAGFEDNSAMGVDEDDELAAVLAMSAGGNDRGGQTRSKNKSKKRKKSNFMTSFEMSKVQNQPNAPLNGDYNQMMNYSKPASKKTKTARVVKKKKAPVTKKAKKATKKKVTKAKSTTSSSSSSSSSSSTKITSTSTSIKSKTVVVHCSGCGKMSFTATVGKRHSHCTKRPIGIRHAPGHIPGGGFWEATPRLSTTSSIAVHCSGCGKMSTRAKAGKVHNSCRKRPMGFWEAMPTQSTTSSMSSSSVTKGNSKSFSSSSSSSSTSSVAKGYSKSFSSSSLSSAKNRSIVFFFCFIVLFIFFFRVPG
jgi:endogenous inhibitor of DNA gyrase (YacG/DUF329 family)